jgi:hypothetical protein
MEDPKLRFRREVNEQESWLAAQPGLNSLYFRTEPECVLEIVARGMPEEVRQAIRTRFPDVTVVFREGDATLHGNAG